MRNRVNFWQYFAMVLFVNCMCSCQGSPRHRTSGVNDEVVPTRRHAQVRHLTKSVILPDWAREESFILVDNLEDGEMERRISFAGVSGKETSIPHDSGKSLSLLQITNGHGFIQLIYSSSDELVDCEYIRQKHVVHGFITKFYQDIDVARSRNFTSPPYTLRHKSLISNHEFRRYIDDNVIPDEYYDLQEMTLVEDAFGMRNLSYKRIKNMQDIPVDMRRWLNFNELKLECSERHRQMKLLVQRINSKDENVRKDAVEHFNRKKRALSDWLIAPNTKWCGRGHNASKYSQLGGASRTDKCCRKHDHCGLYIPGLTTKWQLFNFRPFTLSHCKCDMRFRTCLKMADSPDANMVGKLFFNIVQTKCFVLKPEKVCKRTSWWGKCEERVLRKRAHIRNNRQF